MSNTADFDHTHALGLCKQMMDRAYAPYSKFCVGAVVYADDGAYYGGCNVENAAYPQSHCAESTAISHMIIHGGKHIHAVWVMGNGQPLVSPCGGCRQQIREFATHIHIPIFICCPTQGIRLSTTLNALLPHSFGADTLNTLHK